jgi:hypothetical protein
VWVEVGLLRPCDIQGGSRQDRFVTTDPACLGEMTLTATLEEVSGGTEVTVVFKNLPPPLRAEDNETGVQAWSNWLAASNDKLWIRSISQL